MIVANLIVKNWLYRKINVITSEGVFEIVYDGNGLGYEEVLVDGEIATRINSYLWYVPKFEFFVGSLRAKITVSVWVWLQIRSFAIEIDNETVYSEN